MAAADVDNYVATELNFGVLMGPLDPATLPFNLFHSPIGTITKGQLLHKEDHCGLHPAE